MTTKKIATLFSATALVSVLLAGCVQMEQPLVVDETSQLILGEDFREWYCDIYHKASYCGLEQTGATVVKNYSKDIWIYVNSVQGSVQLELAEEILPGIWVTTHRETANNPGFIERAFTFADVAHRRARVVKANNDLYHVSILAD
jgi:hypothetical protein